MRQLFIRHKYDGKTNVSERVTLIEDRTGSGLATHYSVFADKVFNSTVDGIAAGVLARARPELHWYPGESCLARPGTEHLPLAAKVEAGSNSQPLGSPSSLPRRPTTHSVSSTRPGNSEGRQPVHFLNVLEKVKGF